MAPKGSQSLCIRCGSAAHAFLNRHSNNFTTCQKDYAAVDDLEEADKFNELWWGFTNSSDSEVKNLHNGIFPGGINLTNNDTCKKLLDTAIHVCPVTTDDRTTVQKAEEAKAIATFNGTPITKAMLEKAMCMEYHPPGPKNKPAPKAKANAMNMDPVKKALDGVARNASKDPGPTAGTNATQVSRLEDNTAKHSMPTTPKKFPAAATHASLQPAGTASGTSIPTSASPAASVPLAQPSQQHGTAERTNHSTPASSSTFAILAQASSNMATSSTASAPHTALTVTAPSFTQGSSIPHPVGQSGGGVSQELFPSHVINMDTETALKIVKKYAKCQTTENKDINEVERELGLRTSFAKKPPSDQFSGVVATNYIRMKVPSIIYIYKVRMIEERLLNGEILVKKFADKKALIAELQLNNRVPELTIPGRSWVSDGDLIWSANPMFPHPNGASHVVKIVQNVAYRNECGVPKSVQVVEILKLHSLPCNAATTDLVQLPSNLPGGSDLPMLIRGLNAFLTEHARTSTTNAPTFLGGNKAYLSQAPHGGFMNHKQPKNLSNTGLRALPGFFLSVRPGVNELLININTAFSPFYKLPTTVNDFIRQSKRQPHALSRIMRGVKVQIDFPILGGWGLREDFRFIRSIGEKIAKQTFKAAGQEFTVKKWFESQDLDARRKIDPQFPSKLMDGLLHESVYAVEVATDTLQGSPSRWYPATMLKIVPQQQWHGELHPTETSAMIKMAQLSPEDNAKAILNDGLQMFGLDASGQGSLHNKYSVGTEQELISVNALWLKAPKVQYNKQVKPKSTREMFDATILRASWNLDRDEQKHDPQFVHRPDLISDKALCLNIAGLPKAHDKVQDFMDNMNRALRKHGLLSSPPPSVPQWLMLIPQVSSQNVIAASNSFQYESLLLSELRQEIQDGNIKAPGKPIAVLLEKKDYDIYACVKRVAELHLGINTVHCRMDNKISLPNASNIALKYNLKGSGTNHILESQSFAALRTNNVADTIVIGADVTHPGPGAAPGTPSIAAVVGSTDSQFMHFPGSMRLQRARKEYIGELGDMIKERLIDWAKKHNNRLPARMLFYRDGVSESQYEKLREYEMPQIKKAYSWAREYLNWEKNKTSACLDTSREPWPAPIKSNDDQQAGHKSGLGDDDEFADNTGLNEPFKLTYVVVGKRHNTRFYPTEKYDDKNKTDRYNKPTENGNVHPGLVVDQVITHPHNFDFYLQSHYAIQGTARPAHYFVLRNNMGLSTADLQSITHNFCYAYARATKGVSYCAPAYYADRLCDRGRTYLRHWLQGRDHPTYKSRSRQQDESPTQYNDFVKNELRDRPYWRPYHNANPPQMKYGFRRRNPWHAALDDVMFYL